MSFSTDMTTDVPLLVDEGRTRQQVSSTKKALIVTFSIIGFLLLVGAVILIVVLVTGSEEPKEDYGIIIDAGSSGSRIYVYKWPHRKDKSTMPQVDPVLKKDADSFIKTVFPNIAQLRVIGADQGNTFVSSPCPSSLFCSTDLTFTFVCLVTVSSPELPR